MKMIIGGNHVDSSDGRSIPVYNPATGELIDTVPHATQKDVEHMLDIAQQGKAIWGAMPLRARCDILLRMADLVLENQDILAKMVCQEQGKLLADAVGEVQKAHDLFKGYAQKALHAYGAVLPDNDDDMIVVRRLPLGVIACIIPFNFPAELLAQKVAPALAAGNAVVIKPASDTPLSGIYLVELLLRAGVPAEAIQIATGSGAEIGKLLAASPKINGISVTGSTEVGINIMREAAANMTRVFLELGGNDALIVFDDADIDEAVDQAVNARIANAGQVCCATKRCIVHNSIRAEFAERVTKKMEAIRVGNPMDSHVQMGPLISESAARQAQEQVESAVAQGATCLTGGHRTQGAFFAPTVLTDVTKDMDIAKDLEIFAPVITIIGFDTEEEAVNIANQSIYGLSGGVMTADVNRGMRVALKMESGGVVVGGSGMYRTNDMPFGGHKCSGIGHEGFLDTLEEMCNTKSIVFKGILA